MSQSYQPNLTDFPKDWLSFLVPNPGASVPDNISTAHNKTIIEYMSNDPNPKEPSKDKSHFLDNWSVHYDQKTQGEALPVAIKEIISSVRFFGRNPQNGNPTILFQNLNSTHEFFFKPLEHWSSDAFIIRSYSAEPQCEKPLVLFRNPKLYISAYSVQPGLNLTFSTEDLIYFLCLIWENKDFAAYLRNDYTCITSDKFLIATAFLYLIGAKYTMDYLHVPNLIALSALSLANEFYEESTLGISTAGYIIYYFTQTLPKHFHQLEINERVNMLRDGQETILTKLEYNLIVPLEACYQVFDVFPLHPVWSRDRSKKYAPSFV